MVKTSQVIFILIAVAIFAFALSYFLTYRKKALSCSSCSKVNKDTGVKEVETQIVVTNPATNMETLVSPIGEDPTDGGAGQRAMQTRLATVLTEVDQALGAVVPLPYTKTDLAGNIIEIGHLDPA